VSDSPLQGCTLYLDCFAGIAGDMTLGALLDLGVPEEAVRAALARLPLSGYSLQTGRVLRGGLSGCKVLVEIHAPQLPGTGHDHDPPDHEHHDHDDPHGHGHGDHPHVHYAEIRAMLTGAGLPEDVLRRALAIFDPIAQVEAAIHGVPVAEVRFHEVGAVDSIVDIVGTAAALSWLRPRRVLCRPVPLGHGTVRTAHGLLPVPAPATLSLLRGVPVESGGLPAPAELTTPTGAAILAGCAEAYGPMPSMIVLGTGWGAGDRELPDRPNLLRVVAGTEAPGPQGSPEDGACLILSANLDDMNPELCEPLLDGLLQAGARDVWFQPVHMKKNRPGVVLSVLCDPPLRERLTTLILRESTTLGVRFHRVERTTLSRTFEEVPTPYGAVRMKLGLRDGTVWNAAPEYESCRARAREHGVPVKAVYAAALAAYHRTRFAPRSDS
jgi:hypothetical protein